MKKIKLYFYLVYVVFLAFSTFVALKHEDLVLIWSWDPIDTWTGLIRFVLKLGGIGLVLLVLEVIVENIHILSKNRKIKSLEKEILELKARMYDQSNEEELVVTEEDDPSEEGDEKDEEKRKEKLD
ncbi:hypothetical protein [Reichenbachiella versicolor]|uniref:hypothetical protein n=1 Tax=Reichenbachiella versicolor TaxID=1821036 RepID=UPI000D6E5A09|nr:hypothetical protein [Reichenbachiella versicolor]